MDCGLFHLMEDFILREVEYSQHYGYSSRAKRYMRRKLNQELAPYISEIESQDMDCICEDVSNSDTESIDSTTQNESIILPRYGIKRMDLCIGMMYAFSVTTAYALVSHILYSYFNHSTYIYLNECPNKNI